MNIPKHDLLSALSQFNPWWKGESAIDVPSWHRASFKELSLWIHNPPAPRAVFISGARQVGKTTLLQQAIIQLLKKGVPAANIFYATFDHPIIKLATIDLALEAWREREPKANGIEYIFLDEAQNIRDWGTWIKHQVDFNKNRRIIFTGSSIPLTHQVQESGVGRWHTICLTTLSFYEYLHLKQLSLPKLPLLHSLNDLFNWQKKDFYRTTELAASYVGHFHHYLIRGGFPQAALVENIHYAQRLLREDIIDKVLKRDMTVLFGVRRVLELEMTFLYLCMHDGGLLDIPSICSNLKVAQQTVNHFLELFEATHLIYRLNPFGYGKEILRAKYKVYLADAAIAPAVLLKDKTTFLNDPQALGIAVETAVFKHLYARYYSQNLRLTYWRDKKNQEVDLIAEIGEKIMPFKVKYRSQHTDARDLKGLIQLCQNKSLDRGYVITKSLDDFGSLLIPNTCINIMRIPAPLFCYWMGEAELHNEE
ncbi:MAG: hypothetical protein K0S63_130 [Gammaproteobacteria bacterium]|nr:hypothetical protein [Gammaproteobacteria bacterium]